MDLRVEGRRRVEVDLRESRWGGGVEKEDWEMWLRVGMGVDVEEEIG